MTRWNISLTWLFADTSTSNERPKVEVLQKYCSSGQLLKRIPVRNQTRARRRTRALEIGGTEAEYTHTPSAKKFRPRVYSDPETETEL